MSTSIVRVGIKLILSILVILIISGCSRWIGFKIEFLAFPNDVEFINKENDLNREVLFGLDYSIVIVKKDKGNVSPVTHYRPEHTFGNKVWEANVNFQNPQQISSQIIIDNLNTNTGIAIKKSSEENWKVLWLTDDMIKEIKETKRIKLKPYNEIPYLN